MSKAIGTVALLLVIVVALPAVVRELQAAVPSLITLLVFLGLVRLALPASGRRR